MYSIVFEWQKCLLCFFESFSEEEIIEIMNLKEGKGFHQTAYQWTFSKI